MRQEAYDTTGRLTTIISASGQRLLFSYSTASTPNTTAPGVGYLIGVNDSLGRSVMFFYNSLGQVAQISVPTGNFQKMEYVAGNLAKITWADLSARTFAYNNAALPWALTGVFDESSVLVASFAYDSQGRAVSTERAGGVDRHSVTYATPPSIVVTDTFSPADGVIYRVRSWQTALAPSVTMPNGSALDLGVALVANSPAVTTRSQPAGSGCSASTSGQSYDVNGNVASRDDFNGYRTCYANDLSRNLETTRVEGLAGGASCAVTAAGTALPAGARKINTQWHPDWSLAIKQAEPGRITISVYNGQPDPFAGGSVASCAPTSAMLPGGKRIAVLCRQVEQATTDVDGSQSFAAQGQAGVASREQRWIYNQLGQVLSATDALGKTTTYAYYAATAFGGADPNAVGHTMGDLQSVTNPAGHVTQYALYNKAGQAVQMVDPNGVGTVYQYDARQRLTSIAVGGLTTFYEYWPTGLLKKATQPDGSYLSYGYDDAHRLVQVSDNLGNSIIYTLDSMGNRTTETVMDAGGSLRSQLSRSIDALGRIQQVTGSP